MYAIVRSGGRQHKVAVGDVLTVDKITDAEVGSTVNLTPLMLVDGRENQARFRSSLTGESRALLEDAVTEFQRIAARAPGLITQARTMNRRAVQP